MPFCPSCGTSADGKFCPKCGTAIGVPVGATPPGAGYNAPPPPPGYAPPPPPPPGYQQPPGYQPGYNQGNYTQPPPVINAPGLTSNIAAMLCYIIPVVCPIIFLVVEPYKSDRKVRFDAFQSIFLWVAFIAIGIMVAIIAGMSYHLYFLYSIVRLAEFAVTVLMAINAYQGKKFVLPVIGQLADKQA